MTSSGPRDSFSLKYDLFTQAVMCQQFGMAHVKINTDPAVKEILTPTPEYKNEQEAFLKKYLTNVSKYSNMKH